MTVVEGTYTRFFEPGNRLRILTLLKNLNPFCLDRFEERLSFDSSSWDVKWRDRTERTCFLFSLLCLVCELCLTFLGRQIFTRSIYTFRKTWGDRHSPGIPVSKSRWMKIGWCRNKVFSDVELDDISLALNRDQDLDFGATCIMDVWFRCVGCTRRHGYVIVRRVAIGYCRIKDRYCGRKDSYCRVAVKWWTRGQTLSVNEQVDDEGDKVYLELLERNSVTRENFS